MTEENKIISFRGIADQVSKDFVRQRSVRNRYEESPQFMEDEEKEVIREKTAAIKEQETNALANNQQSPFSDSSLKAHSVAASEVQEAPQEAPQEDKDDTLVNKIDQGLAETG